MPTWHQGTPLELARAEAARTLGGQIQSLTFIDRAPPANGFQNVGPLGHLLESATNSILDPGFNIRTQPRFQIGNRTGREYEQAIAIAPGRGTMDLVFNPALALHAALQQPYDLKAPYLVRSVMAPPYMNMIAGEYDHISSTPTTMDPEERPMKTVEWLDNYGSEIVPARLYQIRNATAPEDHATANMRRPGILQFRVLDDADVPLPLYEGDDSSDWGRNPDGSEDIVVAYNPFNADTAAGPTAGHDHAAVGAGEFHLIGNSDGAPNADRPQGMDDEEYDILILMHVPGARGGYIASANLKGSDFRDDTIKTAGLLVRNDPQFAQRLQTLDPIVAYLGIYATPTRNLLFRQ